MTPLLWLAAIVAFIAVFSYFVIGLIYTAYRSLRDHRERLRTDIEFAIDTFRTGKPSCHPSRTHAPSDVL